MRPKKNIILTILDKRDIITKNFITLLLSVKSLWKAQNNAMWLILDLIYMYRKKCVDDISSGNAP